MKVKAIFSSMIGVSFVFSTAQAANRHEETFDVPSFSKSFCSDFNSLTANDPARELMQIWLQGSISGYDAVNMVSSHEASFSNIINSSNALYASVGQFCQKKPSDFLSWSLSDVVWKLKKAVSSVDSTLDGQDKNLTLGVGEKSCSFFNQHKKDQTGTKVLVWVSGQLEGMDQARTDANPSLSVGVMDTENTNTIYSTFTHQCQKEPSQSIEQAGSVSHRELVKKFHLDFDNSQNQ